MKPLRIGTRSSALALWQAHWVQNALSANRINIGVGADSFLWGHQPCSATV